MRYSTLFNYFLICFFCCGLQLMAFDVQGQQIKEAPGRELSVGIKVAKGKIQYGQNKLFVTDPGSIGMYSGLRYDVPVKLSHDLYLDIAIQSGFLIYKPNVFETTFTDPGTGNLIHQRSRTPNYIPISLGVYNTKTFSVGGEIFSGKALIVSTYGVLSFFRLVIMENNFGRL